MNSQDNAALEALRSDRSRLSLADAATAVSLIAQFDRWALSPAQWRLIHVLAAKAAGAPTSRPQTAIGDLGAINALFDRARGRLKAPAIVFGDGTGREYRLKPAKATARFPGSLNVVTPDGHGWYGRIHATGMFEPSMRVEPPAMLAVALRALAMDPAKVAGAHARKTGRCMFCNLPIGEGRDPRARAVGYGEVCAGSWGLPFPSKAEALAEAAAWLAPPAAPAGMEGAP